MPWASGRTCRVPGCSQLAAGLGTYRCPPHERQYRADLDAGRQSPSKRGYNATWAKVRRAWLAAHPRCVRCGALATEVDHIVALKAGGTNSGTNLRSFCKPCHSWRTGRDQGGFTRR